MNKKLLPIFLAVGLALLVAVTPALAANLVSNPGFESGSGTDADSWSEGTYWDRTDAMYHNGGSSMYHSSSSGATATTQSASLSNTTYYVSVWIYRVSGSVTAYLDFADAAGEPTLSSTTTGAWQYLSGSFTPASAGSYTVRLVANGTTYFDDVCLSTTESECAETAVTNTPTPTSTFTATYTPTVTSTPTQTLTPTPMPATIWADGLVTLDEDLLADIASLLQSSPPADASGTVYAVTHVSGSDGGWYVSVINLVDVGSPYTEWNAEDNGGWAGSVYCTGTDPDWSCAYPSAPAAGGSSGMILPWRSGYSAIYGTRGVHRDTNSIIPNSYAVDFVGNGTGTIMPASVIAVANGTVTWVCSDGTSVAVKVEGGPVDVAYFHFASGTNFEVGQTISQGQVLGTLRYGSFSGSACGWGSQSPSEYHLHFVFLPTTAGYLQIGACVLNLGTQSFVCNGSTYPPLAVIPNAGGSSSIEDSGDTTGDTSSLAMGGTHLWDGMLSAVDASVNSLATNLQDHTAIGIETMTVTAATYILDTYSMIAALQLFYMVPVFVFIYLWLALEIIRWILAGFRWVFQFIPTMG